VEKQNPDRFCFSVQMIVILKPKEDTVICYAVKKLCATRAVSITDLVMEFLQEDLCYSLHSAPRCLTLE